MSQGALGAASRFGIYNTTGITISNGPSGFPTIVGMRARFDTTGALSYENGGVSFTVFYSNVAGVSVIGAASYVTGSAFSNTASLWLFGDFLFSAFASGNASGNLNVYLEISPDGGTTWPSPFSANGLGGGVLIATLAFASTTTASTASTIRSTTFEL